MLTYAEPFRRAEPLVSGTKIVARSLEPRRELGTDLEGRVSKFSWPLLGGSGNKSDGGEVSCEPERLLRVLAGGSAKLDAEYLLGLGRVEEKDCSRRSGGVVGSL